MWDQRPEKLQDEEWAEETAVMEAGQELWTVWSLKEWAQEMPYYKFFSVYSKAMVPGQRSVALADINMTDTQEMPLFEEDNKDFETSLVQKSYATSEGLGKRKAAEILGRASMGSGPSNTRPTKVSKTGSGQPSTKQAKAPVDIARGLSFWRAKDHGFACKNSVGDTARDAQRRARVVRKREKRAAAPATQAARTVDDKEEEVLRVPDFGEGDDGAPVTPEGAEGDGESESAKSVWRPAEELATEFEQVTRRVGELRELEAGMANYAAACKREYAALRLELLRLQTTLGETWRLQETLVEARREAEEVLWEILAFE
ncbi:hypothetical protein C0991_007211 [Blastosporella zonata]|nr:hypothetical protein C0991_007211 [Blastosporella zonata]